MTKLKSVWISLIFAELIIVPNNAFSSETSAAYRELADLTESQLASGDCLNGLRNANKLIEMNPKALDGYDYRSFCRDRYRSSESNEAVDFKGALSDYNKIIDTLHTSKIFNKKKDDWKKDISRFYYRRSLLRSTKGRKSDINLAVIDMTSAIHYLPKYSDLYKERGFMLLGMRFFRDGCNDLKKAASLGDDFSKKFLRNNVANEGKMCKTGKWIRNGYSNSIDSPGSGAKPKGWARERIYKTQEEYLKRVKNLNSDIALVKRANMYLENGKKLRDFRGNKYKKNRFYSYACNDYQKASQLGNKKAKNWLSSENGKVCNNSYYVNDYINNSL